MLRLYLYCYNTDMLEYILLVRCTLLRLWDLYDTNTPGDSWILYFPGNSSELIFSLANFRCTLVQKQKHCTVRIYYDKYHCEIKYIL